MINTVNIVSRQSNLQKYKKPREFRGTPYGTILSQAPLGKVQRLSRNGVHLSKWKCEAPVFQGDDIVSSIWQHIAVHKRTHRDLRPLWKILDIQARLYWRLIRMNMDRDDYFKDFKLAPYRFIVVTSTGNPNPLIWGFEKTTEKGTLTLGNKVFRDPEEIGKELSQYLTERPAVPNGITTNSINSLSKWIEKL